MKSEGPQYVNRTQKDYTLSFKLQVVHEVEGGELTIGATARKYGVQNPSTVTNWLRKFCNFDWQTQTPSVMKKRINAKSRWGREFCVSLRNSKGY